MSLKINPAWEGVIERLCWQMCLNLLFQSQMIVPVFLLLSFRIHLHKPWPSWFALQTQHKRPAKNQIPHLCMSRSTAPSSLYIFLQWKWRTVVSSWGQHAVINVPAWRRKLRFIKHREAHTLTFIHTDHTVQWYQHQDHVKKLKHQRKTWLTLCLQACTWPW